MREIKIGGQSFEAIRSGNYFYVDKTLFIKEWWEAGDDVTLVTRPRRFGKTLNMDMLNCFFSNRYAGRSDLFEGTEIWKEEKYRKLQGAYPVIYLSFANIKGNNYEDARLWMIRVLQQVFLKFKDQWAEDTEQEKSRYSFLNISEESSDVDIAFALNRLSAYLEYRYGRKVLILLDEYDTPLQEAYTNGYWNEMSAFIKGLFNSTFKTNPSLERAIMTGITRVSKESIFSDLNNLTVVSTTTRKYETSFGFTQKEVDEALQEYGLSDQSEMVKKWYDGFTFGRTENIYNPWSIIQFLDSQGDFQPYWANTSSNQLISYELQIADDSIKSRMEGLLNGGTVETELDEQIIFSQLETNQEAIWSLMLAGGYLTVAGRNFDGEVYHYVLKITNLEVKVTFRNLIGQWFGPVKDDYRDFVKFLIAGDQDSVEEELKDILTGSVSFYDTSKKTTDLGRHESFYHGLVLGMVAQEKEYRITSNRESGRGRYDVMMKPLQKGLPGIIIEFKVFDPKREKNLQDTADRALRQIKEKKYDAELLSENISEDNILHYGMAFSEKNVVVKAE